MRILSKFVLIVLGAVFFVVVALGIQAEPNNKEIRETTVSNVVSNATAITTQEPVVNTPEPEATPEYPLTQEEIELIALVTMAEAEGETELGQRLVIDTILNRVDDSHFPDTVTDVIYYPNAFSSMRNGRVDRCYVKEEIVELVKEELLKRTNYDCVFFTAGAYSSYGVPMFQECCHYFSSYN